METKTLMQKARAIGVPSDSVPHLLIVDDNTVNRFKLNLYVKTIGYTATMVETGEEALESLKKEKFELILLDMNLPGMDGDEVIRRIKSFPATSDLPIILVSDSEELERIKTCLELGADDYLPKPVDQMLLKSRVSSCLEKKRLREQYVLTNNEIAMLNQAVIALEKGQFDPATLNPLLTRRDSLGELARNFQRMALSLQQSKV